MALRDVETSLQTLWTKKSEREKFLKGKLNLFPAGQEPDPKGIELYATLLNRGQIDLMESIYPACQRLISDFETLVYRYMEECPPTHFNLNQSAKGFSKYLETNCPELVKKFPFLPELADYEWIELEVMEDEVEWPPSEQIELNDPGLFATYRPVLNSTLKLKNYKYPISEIVDKLIDSEESEKTIAKRVKESPVTLAIFREPKEHDARFLELGELSTFIVKTILAEKPTYQTLIAASVQAFPKKKADSLVLELLEIFSKLEEHKLILGKAR